MAGERIIHGAFPHTCPLCELIIGESEWEVMELKGWQEVPADPDDKEDPHPYKLEMRNCGCGTTISLRVAPNLMLRARNLEELLDVMMKLKHCDFQHVGETQLPTFGGEEPAVLTNVWSWDETRLLVGGRLELLRIVARNPA